MDNKLAGLKTTIFERSGKVGSLVRGCNSLLHLRIRNSIESEALRLGFYKYVDGVIEDLSKHPDQFFKTLQAIKKNMSDLDGFIRVNYDAGSIECSDLYEAMKYIDWCIMVRKFSHNRIRFYTLDYLYKNYIFRGLIL